MHGKLGTNFGTSDSAEIGLKLLSKEHRLKRIRLSDLSVVAFSSTISAVNKSAVLADYREHPGFFFFIFDCL